jgi:hypothetical protein
MKALQWLAIVISVPFFIAALPFLVLWWVFDLLYIHIRLLSFCAPHGQRVLFVYSNSPNWQDYCEREILPALPENAVVLNWSERLKWPRRSFATRLFRGYSGDKQFNPIGIVFRPFRRRSIFRFWQPVSRSEAWQAAQIGATEGRIPSSSSPAGLKPCATENQATGATVRLKADPTEGSHDEIRRSLKQILLTS